MKKRSYLWIVLCLALAGGCGQKETDITENKAEQDVLTNENVENAENEAGKELQERKNGLIFTTEYTVEDYCHGCYIVSKNDGLLYGVLDRNGNEILPVKYDDIYFLNDKTLESNIDTNLYMAVIYENEYSVVNQDRNEIFHKTMNNMVYEMECPNYKLSNGNERFFYFAEEDKESHMINFYNESGEFISGIDYLCFMDKSLLESVDMDKSRITMTKIWISEEYYMLDVTALLTKDSDSIVGANVMLLNKNHEIVNEWRAGYSYSGSEVLDNNFVFYWTVKSLHHLRSQ